MEKISTEILVSALFNLGFDIVDPVLFTYTLGKLSLEDKNQQFSFEEETPSIGFNKYVDSSGIAFKIKDGYTLETDVSPVDSGIRIPVKKALFSSRKLLEFLTEIDFNEVVLKKAATYGVSDYDSINHELFSKKEVEILKTCQNENARVYSMSYKPQSDILS